MYEEDKDNNEYFQVIIDNYEALVKELNEELCALKYEQENLKEQLSIVVTENNQLSQTVQNGLSSKQSGICENDNQEILINLRCQIDTLITEKECVTRLWQEAVKTIDNLEDQLKVFQAGTESFVPKKDLHKLKYLYEEKIKDLELKLTITEKKLETSIKQAKAKLDIKHCEIDKSLENQASALKIVKNLECEVLKLQKRLEETAEERSRLERTLGHKEDVIQTLKMTNLDCLSRVTEAVSVVEAALNEKDAALFREKQIKEENEKLVQEMTEIVKESQEKIKLGTLRLNAEYGEKQKVFVEELERAQKEVKNKSSEIEAKNKKCSLLEHEIERMHKGHCGIEESEINKMLVLEKNLESTFQKLLISEKQNIQLASDKEIMKNDLDQMAGIYERNLKGKEIEIATLQSKVNRLESELNDSHKQVMRITEKMSQISEQIEKTEKEFREEKEKYEKRLKTAHEDKIEHLNRKYNDNLKELQSQVEKKNELNQKWRKETKVITDNLERLVTNLKQDVQSLKKESKILKDNLRKSEEKVNQYKMFLELISKDVSKISHLTLGAGVS